MNTVITINNRMIIENNEIKMLPYPFDNIVDRSHNNCIIKDNNLDYKTDSISDFDISEYDSSEFGSDIDSYTICSDSATSDLTSDSSSVSSDDNSCFRRPSRKKRDRLNLIESIYFEYQSNTNNPSNPSGYTSELTKDNPIIADLISRRIRNCIVGPSSHIAAFLSSNIDIRSCFISGYRKKGRYR